MKRMARPAKKSTAGTKTITVRLPVAQLRRVMRARNVTTAAELIRMLLDEEDERLTSEAALRKTAGTLRHGDFDARLL